MSIYTKCFIQIHLLKDFGLPEEVENVLRYLHDHNLPEPPKPNHLFFTLPRWDVFKCNFEENLGYYSSEVLHFEPIADQGINHEQGEIIQLLNWLRPWCYLTVDNGWAGWYQNEGDNTFYPIFWEK